METYLGYGSNGQVSVALSKTLNNPVIGSGHGVINSNINLIVKTTTFTDRRS